MKATDVELLRCPSHRCFPTSGIVSRILWNSRSTDCISHFTMNDGPISAGPSPPLRSVVVTFTAVILDDSAAALGLFGGIDTRPDWRGILGGERREQSNRDRGEQGRPSEMHIFKDTRGQGLTPSGERLRSIRRQQE